MKLVKTVITYTLLFSAVVCASQEVSRSIQSSSGGHIKNNQGYTIEWTFGAQFSQTVKSENHLTEGFQQGSLNKQKIVETLKREQLNISEDNLDNSIKSIINPSLAISVFPNPTIKNLFINIEEGDIDHATIYVYDSNGKPVITQNIGLENSQQIEVRSISTLPAGHYFLQIKSRSSSEFISFVKVK